LLVLISTALNPAVRAADPGKGFDRWYILQMQGKRAGWVHETEAPVGDNIRSTTDIHVQVKRGSVAIGITIDSEFIETAAGKPVSMKSTETLGTTPTIKEYRFTDKSI